MINLAGDQFGERDVERGVVAGDDRLADLDVVEQLGLAGGEVVRKPRRRPHVGLLRHLVKKPYFVASQLRRAAFLSSSLACLAARFSLRVLPGFFGWLAGVDLFPITP